MARRPGRVSRDREWEKVEKFIRQQMALYVKLHKEHEKNLNYIG